MGLVPPVLPPFSIGYVSLIGMILLIPTSILPRRWA